MITWRYGAVQLRTEFYECSVMNRARLCEEEEGEGRRRRGQSLLGASHNKVWGILPPYLDTVEEQNYEDDRFSFLIFCFKSLYMQIRSSKQFSKNGR